MLTEFLSAKLGGIQGQPSVNHLLWWNLYRRQREKSLAARNPARNIATSEFLAVGEKNIADSENTSDISSEISLDKSRDISLLFSLEARSPAIISRRFIAGNIAGNIARV